jgi:hypothetical protein
MEVKKEGVERERGRKIGGEGVGVERESREVER